MNNGLSSTIARQPAQGAIFKDRLLSKVYSLLEEEIALEKSLQEEYKELKKEYQVTSVEHKGLIKKYKEEQYNGGKILEESEYD